MADLFESFSLGVATPFIFLATGAGFDACIEILSTLGPIGMIVAVILAIGDKIDGLDELVDYIDGKKGIVPLIGFALSSMLLGSIPGI